MKKAQIILFGILNVYSKAVELALECGDQLIARDYANKPKDKKVQRDLWMKIAEYLFQSDRATTGGQLNVQKALEFIRTESSLKVEDLLEKFPKEARVEDMKEHLCKCLEDYENKITALRNKIEKNSQNAEQLRNQKRNQRNKHITINPSQCCDICYATVFDREFYIFPCLHAFHRECISAILLDEKYQPKDAKVRVMVDQLRRHYGKINAQFQLKNLQMQEQNQGNSNEDKSLLSGITTGISDFFTQSISLKGGVPANMQMSTELQFNAMQPKGQTEQQQRLWNEALNMIDEILKRECFFCGPILIDMIDCDVEGDGKESEFGLARNLASEIKQTNEWDII